MQLKEHSTDLVFHFHTLGRNVRQVKKKKAMVKIWSWDIRTFSRLYGAGLKNTQSYNSHNAAQ